MTKTRTPFLEREDFAKGKDLGDGSSIALVKAGGIDGAILKGRDEVRAFLKAEQVTDAAEFKHKLSDEAIEKAVDETSASEISFPFVLSTKAPDRQGDTIDQAGWDLASYRKNPVVLWAHDYETLPVARASAVYVAGDRLKAVDRFSDDHELARTVCTLISKGFLNAVSVGFRPKKWAWNEERGGMAADFFEVELLEHSVVPVPAHQDALIEARSAGIAIGPVLKWATAFIEATDSGLFIPREQLADAVAKTSTRVVVDFGNRKALTVSEPVEPAAPTPVEVSVETAMSTIAKAGYAVVDLAVLNKVMADAEAARAAAVAKTEETPAASEIVEPVAVPAVETPTPVVEAVDPLAALLEDPEALREMFREELGNGSKSMREARMRLTGSLD